MSFFTKPTVTFLASLAAALALAGCDNRQVRAYTVPKETPWEPPKQQAAHDPNHEGHEHEHENEQEPWRPEIAYTLPAGWQDRGPDAANVANFSASGADVSVTALASMRGNEAGLVNMWRQVRGEQPLADDEALKTLADVEVGGERGMMFEYADTGGEKPRRFIVAFTHRAEGSLFFKIQGPDSDVTAQRDAFFAFLKTVRFTGGKAAAPAGKPAPEMKLPEGWTRAEPGPMQVAKFNVTPKSGAGKAEVAVSVFPSDTGGTAANVKRWRGQLGMPEVDDATAAAAAKPIEGAPEGSLIVDLEHNGQAMVSAIVPRAGQFVFFKLTGDATAVASARESLVELIKGTP